MVVFSTNKTTQVQTTKPHEQEIRDKHIIAEVVSLTTGGTDAEVTTW